MMTLKKVASIYDTKLASEYAKKEIALSRLEELVKIPGGVYSRIDLKIDYSNPFEDFESKISGREDFFDYIQQLWMLAPGKDFVINDLIACQGFIDRELVSSIIKNGYTKLPHVCTFKNKVHIVDGHNRIMAQKLLGETSVGAKYLDLEKLGL